MTSDHFLLAIRKAAYLLTAVVASTAAIGSVAAAEVTQTLVSAGVERSYLLHVPAGYDGRSALPLVLNFHGSLVTPQTQVEASKMGVVADREGFVLVYPTGIYTSASTRNSWNADLETGVDDVQFVRDIIDDVAKKVNLNRSRVFVTGFSGGGRISSRMACELSDVLAAAAPVSGVQYYEDCTPAQPIPLLTIHGNADRFNHYELRDNSPGYWHMGVETAVEKWRTANGCSAAPTVSKAADKLELRASTNCRGGSEVMFYVVEGGDHVWPEFASELVWQFFARH